MIHREGESEATRRDHVARQRAFYDERAHAHLQAQDEDAYAAKLAARMADALGLGPEARVLEVGAGFGRFTFELLAHCREVVALDLSPVALGELEDARDRRGIPAERCRALCGDLDAFDPAVVGGPFDAVAGFFLLHHLPDPARSVRALAAGLRPGGRMAFLEPNRRNPLFLAQVACCPDMTWAEEKGMFSLSQKSVESAYRRAGLERVQADAFGFFPPQLFNRSDGLRRLEARLEGIALLRRFLPFLLVVGHAPESPE